MPASKYEKEPRKSMTCSGSFFGVCYALDGRARKSSDDTMIVCGYESFYSHFVGLLDVSIN